MNIVENRGKYHNRYIMPKNNAITIISGQHKPPGRYQSFQIIKRTLFQMHTSKYTRNISFKVNRKSKQQTHRHFT